MTRSSEIRRRNCATYHGVLSHQDDTLSAESSTDLVHLLRADIVNADDEDTLVLFEETLELVEVAGLVFGLAPHIFLFEGRMFKGQVIGVRLGSFLGEGRESCC